MQNHIVQVKSYVWCDVHGQVHQRTGDPHDMGYAECHTHEWRELYTVGYKGEKF